jgi:excisionase family DNA binding protein
MSIDQETANPAPAHPRVVLTIEEAADSLGIGRSFMYALVQAGEIESVRIGRLHRIPVAALDGYIDRLRASLPAPRRN